MPETGASPEMFTSVDTASELHGALSAAIQQLRSASPDNRTKGILVTALAPGSFRVCFSEDVAYGVTRERYAY